MSWRRVPSQLCVHSCNASGFGRSICRVRVWVTAGQYLDGNAGSDLSMYRYNWMFVLSMLWIWCLHGICPS